MYSIIPTTSQHQTTNLNFKAGTPKKITNPKTFDDLSKMLLTQCNETSGLENLKTQLNNLLKNPSKNKQFFAILASLLTATAAKITELISDEEENTKSVVSNDGDEVILNSTSKTTKKITKGKTKKQTDNSPILIKFKKHLGMAGKSEKALETAINNSISKFELEIPEQNQLIAFYNQFCGVNNKGTSFSATNEELANSTIAQNLADKINNSVDKETLTKIKEEFSTYTTDKKENLQPTEEIVVPSQLQVRNNLKESYLKQDKDSRNMIDEFISSVCQNPLNVQKRVFGRISSNYPECLSHISAAYFSIPPESRKREALISQIANNTISKEALETWGTDKISCLFDFIEYNSLLFNSVDKDTIEKLALMKKSGSLQHIYLNFYNKGLELTSRKIFIGDSLKLISDIYKRVRPSKYRLNDSDEGPITIADIEAEVTKKRSSYLKLYKYLSIDGKDYLNEGKMSNLIVTFNNSQFNKDIFTMHSYLRFIERYVMPEFDSTDRIYTGQLTSTYIAKVKNLKEALNKVLNEQLSIKEYTTNDSNISAPKIEIFDNNNKQKYTITINAQGKIHTIF
jgi:hypothetical protein